MPPFLDVALMMELGADVCRALMTSNDWGIMLDRFFYQQDLADA